MTLHLYLTRSFLIRFVALIAGLVVMLLMLDLLANAGEVIEGGGDPAASLMRYMGLRTPVIVETVAPLASLLAALSALIAAARASEIIAMRAAGVSVFILIRTLMIAGGILAVGLFWFSETLVVRTNAELADWQKADYKPEGAVVEGEGNWMTEGNTMIRVGHVMRDGTVLYDIRTFDYDDARDLRDITNIRLAIWENGEWTAFKVTHPGDPTRSEESTVWATKLTPEHFLRAAAEPGKLSYFKLRDWFKDVSFGNRPAYFYQTWLHQKLAGPLVLLLMPLLAGIAAFTGHRSGSTVLVMSQGIGIGFLFVVTDNMMLAMGQFGLLPPLLAAWLPLVLFAIGGSWVILEKEN